MLLEIASEHVTEVFTGFGEIGVRAEAVASRAADEARQYLASTRRSDPTSPISCCCRSRSAAAACSARGALSRHTTTNIDVIQAMTDARIEVADDARDGDAHGR